MNFLYIGNKQVLGAKFSKTLKAHYAKKAQVECHSISLYERKECIHDNCDPNYDYVFYELTEDDKEKEKALLKVVRKKHSLAHFVLLVESNIDYFEIANTFGIGILLQKERMDEFSLLNSIMYCESLCMSHMYSRFFVEKKIVSKEWSVTGDMRVQEIMESFEKECLTWVSDSERTRIKTYFYEILVNAFMYSVMGVTAKERDEGFMSFKDNLYVPEDKKIVYTFVMDEEKYGISVKDSSGNLTVNRVLEKIRRQSIIGDEEQPQGIWDMTGRGLLLIQRDNQLFVNTQKDISTEVMFLHYKNKARNKYESIYVVERN